MKSILSNKLELGELRKSQTLTVYGPGAIVDFPHFSGIMSSSDVWEYGDENRGFKRIRESNLENDFGVKYFVEPSCDESVKHKYFLRAYRFPEWYYCPKCHALGSYRDIGILLSNKDDDIKIGRLICALCNEHGMKVDLVPSRFIVSCINGHLDDFPYDWWVHQHHRHNGDFPKEFTLEYTAKTGGLDSIVVRCSCGAYATMAGCMKEDAFINYKKGCSMHMPWLGYEEINGALYWHRDKYSDSCEAKVKCLQRSSSNVYYPILKSALTVPPFSQKKYEQVEKAYKTWFGDFLEDKSENNEGLLVTFERCESAQKDLLLKKFEKKKDDFNGTVDEFYCIMKDVIKNSEKGDDSENEQADAGLLWNEYSAFCGSDVNDEKLYTENVPVPSRFSKFIKKVTKVKKLREVSVLTGFTRIYPPGVPEEEKDLSGKYNRDFVPISGLNKMDWLPGMELYGEGIFIQLNSEKVAGWEKEIVSKERFKTISAKLSGNLKYLRKGKFSSSSPRYILLHTLSHLLIRSLAAECGYATASLKEKIYSTIEGSDKDMCGILIYTAVSDSDGSLGGLVRQGDTQKFEEIMVHMFHDSTWCSNDPLCIESESQGYSGLNYAACHACTLLPETSCENYNCLLDRATIVGKPNDKTISYFYEILEDII